MLASYIFLVLHVLFCVDIMISFRVAFHENEDLITDPAETARNYRRRALAFQCTMQSMSLGIPVSVLFTWRCCGLPSPVKGCQAASNCLVDLAGRA